jgi:peptidoglycan/LPS O-acetylase OafA/YrhL
MPAHARNLLLSYFIVASLRVRVDVVRQNRARIVTVHACLYSRVGDYALQVTTLKQSVSTPQKGHLTALDGVRGLGLIAVIAGHANIFPLAWPAIELFFVLSGHFITRILLKYVRAPEDQSRRAVAANFLRNRVLRLAPIYALACAGLTVFSLVAGSFSRQAKIDLPYLWTWTYDLRRLSGGWVDNQVYDHVWSLGVEVQLYLLWLALALALPFVWFRRVLVGLAVAGPVVRGLVWVGLAALGHANLALVTYGLPTTYVDAFAIGGLTAFPEIRAWVAQHAWVLRIPVLVCAGYAVLTEAISLARHGRFRLDLGLPLTLPEHYDWVWIYSAVAALSAAIVLTCLKPGRMTSLLSTPILVRFGVLSYAAYLVHRPIMAVIHSSFPASNQGLGGLLTTIVVLALSMSVSMFTFRFVEQPFMARKRGARAN